MSTKSKTVFLSVSNSEVSLSKPATSTCYDVAIVTILALILAAHLIIITFFIYYDYYKYIDWMCTQIKNIIIYCFVCFM